MTVMSMSTDPRAALRARLAASSDGVLETLAAEHGLSVREAAACLPPETGLEVSGAHFLEALADIATWGEILLLTHTEAGILECKGVLPAGTLGHGYYNLRGPGPLGGHLRPEACAALRFVSRPFMGHESHAVWFFAASGTVLFKIFVGRTAPGSLEAEQVARFHALKARLAAAESSHGG